MRRNERTVIFAKTMRWYLNNFLVFLLILLKLCVSQQPADKGANAKTKEILDYMAGLPRQGMPYVD
jgi:hypothetical protein